MSIDKPSNRLESGSGQSWLNRLAWIAAGVGIVMIGTNVLLHEVFHTNAHHVIAATREKMRMAFAT